MKLLTGKYQDNIAFTLSCYDRVILNGTLPEISYPQGLTNYLYQNEIRIFDYARFAEPLNEEIRHNAEQLAQDNGITIEFIRKSGVRKEAIIAEKIKNRGRSPGLVHILSVMESCSMVITAITIKQWKVKAGDRSQRRAPTRPPG